MLPKITIITPSFQQMEFLEACLRSVHDQGYPDLEHMIVDGGSTDGSVDVIQRFAGHLAWWKSAPDGGQSDAIDQGLQRSTGQVFNWLNSDDLLLPGSLETVGRAFEETAGLVAFGGHRILLHPDGTSERSKLNDVTDRDALFIAPSMDQQSTFYRTDAVKAVGGVDVALRYCMDLDLWWRVLFAFGTTRLRFEPVDLAVFRLHAESKTMKEGKAFVVETAGLLRAMAMATDQPDLVGLLDRGYPDAPRLRASNATPEHATIVRRMIFRFLVKWNGNITDARQFALLRRLRVLMPDASDLHEPAMKARWLDLRPGLAAPGWAAYRLGRKLGWWRA